FALGASGDLPVVLRDGRPAVAARGTAGELFADTALDLVGAGRVRCTSVLTALRELTLDPDEAARITGVDPAAIREAVRLMVENRPVGYHTWNGIMQHTNATQAGRAIEIFFAFLGDWDRPGGNVVPSRARTADIVGAPLDPAAAAKRLGRQDRPLGPPAAPPGHIVAYG